MNHHHRVHLGRSGLQVTRMGLNLAAIGRLAPGLPDHATAVIDRAWQHGLRLFDTAPQYGDGSAERHTGQALATRPRDDFILTTKVGQHVAAGSAYLWLGETDTSGEDLQADFTYDGVHRSLEQSMRRLGTDRLDVVHLHDPVRRADEALRGGYKALVQLRAAGTVGAISASTDHVGLLAEYATIGRRGNQHDPGFDCFLIAGRYTLLDQSGLDLLLPRCAAWGLGVMAAGALHPGLLTGATAPNQPAYVKARAEAIRRVCDLHGVPVRAAALQFPLGHPAVATVLVGARSPQQLDDDIAMFNHPIPTALWADLKQRNLIEQRSPVPR
ncbi:D-threo-aldose 1-dehydrogenase [Catellatospora citrea]|nr:D-threo-aldose 1-dehydrogenase [Catellatospora citrea]